MRILLSHNSFPSQFRRLCQYWLDQGHDVRFLASRQEWHAPNIESLPLLSYTPRKFYPSAYSHPYLHRLEKAVLEGQSALRRCIQLKESGWYPDVVISHVGFGNGLFLRQCFPEALRIGLVEWFYNSTGSDVDFLTGGEPPSINHCARLQIWNSEVLLELSTLDKVVVPTHWQKAQFPSLFRDQLTVIHEGIDYQNLSRLSQFPPPSLPCLPDDDNLKVITYVSRCFETYRGFPQFIRVIERIQRLRSNVHVLIVGQDGSAYSPPRSDGMPWSTWATDNFDLDPLRTHWLGSLQTQQYIDVLRRSDVHFYLSIPFILSWSLLEAMSVGCAIVSSTTPPVLEVLENNKSGLLNDFFDIEAHVTSVLTLLDDSRLARSLSKEAQSAASFYCSTHGFRAWDSLLS